MPLVKRVVSETDPRAFITGIVVGVGPGPFTGLRVGVVSALVLGRALGVEVRGVCSLDAVAAAVTIDGPFAVTADAKRRELYWATYDGPASRTEGPSVAAPTVIAERIGALSVAGAGPLRYPDAFASVIGPTGLTAAGLVRAAQHTDALLNPTPLYLREPDAVAGQTAKPVTPGSRE